ncbi:MAG: hypothetical protein CMF51_00785 [Legionellales bacterium]|nr:hypothetical protein [Legionellales bacterium]|tara:strand:- start:199 stop:978 length:780 start_codon:yes stop_codon:yes gene_type:complete
MAPKRHVICIKWGDRYTAEYVNKLYSMVQRNLTLSHQFHCLTEDPTDINPNINILAIPKKEIPLKGWWQKVALFKKNFYGLQGEMLFIDLDMIILSNIDDFFHFAPGQFCMTRNFLKRYKGDPIQATHPSHVSSCVMRFKIGSISHIWDQFIQDQEAIITRHQKGGDQEWIYTAASMVTLWPLDWVSFYKENFKYRLTPFSAAIFKKMVSKLSASLSLYAQKPTQGKILAFQNKPDIHEILSEPSGKYRAAPWLKEYWH